MGFKSKTMAIATSLIIISSSVTVQANTLVALQQGASLCAGGFAGCVLPAKTAPAPVAAPAAPAAAEVVDEKGFPILVPLLAAGAVIAAILIASEGDEDAPTSP